MSAHPPSGQSSSHSSGADDKIDFPKVITVGVVSLIVFAIASYWAYSILRGERTALDKKGVASEPSELGKAEIGIVDQVPFQGDKRLDIWKKEQHELLNSYGWSDRKHGLIRIPIEEAMKAVVAGVAPAVPPGQGPAGGPPPPAPQPAGGTK
jgi:hypothetical protein